MGRVTGAAKPVDSSGNQAAVCIIGLPRVSQAPEEGVMMKLEVISANREANV